MRKQAGLDPEVVKKVAEARSKYAETFVDMPISESESGLKLL